MIRTIFNEKFDRAVENEKIIFYDYLEYKRYIGWSTFGFNDDWQRPSSLEYAVYNADYISSLPNIYYLGISVKDIIRSSWSNGRCHACSVGLSLCYDDFKLVTCNLKNYAEYYNVNTEPVYVECYDEADMIASKKYEHTFLVLEDKTVIDTTFGILTDIDTYEDVFGVENKKIVTKDEIKNTKIYKFLLQHKDLIAPPYWCPCNDKEKKIQQDFEDIIKEYIEGCKNYKNEDNVHLQDFISRCLYRTTHQDCVDDWISNMDKKFINHRDYPRRNMVSIIDDINDEFLYSKYAKTQLKNIETKKKYIDDMNEKEEKNKGKRFSKIKKIINKFKKR